MGKIIKINNTIQEILHAPDTIIPSLSYEEIKTVLAQAISLHQKNKMTLEKLIQIAHAIQMTQKTLPDDLRKITKDLKSLSAINDFLTDVRQELRVKSKY